MVAPETDRFLGDPVNEPVLGDLAQDNGATTGEALGLAALMHSCCVGRGRPRGTIGEGDGRRRRLEELAAVQVGHIVESGYPACG